MRDVIPGARRNGARWTSRASALALVAAGLAVPQFASAQEAAEEEGTIVVTGSRIQRSTFNSSTPLTVIGSETIEQLGQVNIGETLRTLPQNVSNTGDTNTGLSANTNNPNIGSQLANLRGLNPGRGVRTLTLIDTRRHVPTDPGGGVDMNMIPSILVQSVETVTGGASAAYGTDALAGVVNILLDTRLEGIKAQIDYGETFRGDGSDLHAGIGGGMSFADGRGHIMGGVEYQDSGKVGDCVYVREWCAESPGTWQNENNQAVGGNGLPRYIRGIDSAYTNYSLEGVFRGTPTGTRFNPPALRNLTFTPDGRRAIDFDGGDFVQGTGFFDRRGGDCLVDCSPWSEVQLRPEVERLTAFGHAEYELTSSITATLEGSYGFRNGHVMGLSLGPNSATPIREDNAYLRGVTYLNRLTGQTVLLTDLIAANQTGGSSQTGVSQAPGVPRLPIFVAKHLVNVPGARNDINTEMDTWRVMAGLEGDLPFLEGWTWDTYYQYGKTKQDISIGGLRINEYFTAALDAVDEGMMRTMQRDVNGNWIPNSGTPNGNIVCRGTLLGPGANPVATPNSITPTGFFQHWNLPYAAGCVPFNIIGSQPDPRGTAFAYRTATQDFAYQQHVFALNTGGDVFEGWAGPIALALGGEYRFEKGVAVHNKLPLANFSVDAFGNDYSGTLKILEGYVETNIPLLRDLPLVDYLELNGAFRRTEQTNKDTVFNNSKDLGFNTWKLTGSWDVTDWLRFRGTRSRDVRAASFIDLYYNLGKTEAGPPAGRVLNPWYLLANGSQREDFADILYPPNFSLSPEVGNTWTVGGVLTPGGALDGLRLSVDYYNIKIKDAIVVLTAQQVVDSCFTANIGCDRLLTGLNGGGTVYNPTAAGSAPESAGGTGIESVSRGGANIGRFTQAGWDVEMQYRMPLDKFGDNIPGTITWRGLATITDKMLVDIGNGVVRNYRNQTGGAAFGGFTAPSKYILTSYLTYDNEGFSITIDNRYIPTGIYDINRCLAVVECPTTSNISINDNSVDSKLYTGLSTSYEFGLKGDSTAEVFFSIRNLFDTTPPYTVSNATGQGGPVQGNGGPTNPVYYDTLGARWRAGLRLNF